MANTVINIPFYVAKNGEPLTGASSQMEFETLKTLSGTDKSGDAPAISEIGGGWYKFAVAYGQTPFNASDLVGVIDADKNGSNNLTTAERYIPIEVRLDFYALSRLVNKMGQDKLTGDMLIKNSDGNVILKLGITDSEDTLERSPEVAG